jgi:hypothetical protein
MQVTFSETSDTKFASDGAMICSFLLTFWNVLVMRLLQRIQSDTRQRQRETVTTVPLSVFANCPFCNIHALCSPQLITLVSLWERERERERERGEHIVCANDIWIERAFRRPDTDTMAPISTFLDGGMIRPGSGLWDSLSSPGNTRKLFATGSLDHFNASHEHDVPIYLSYAWHDSMLTDASFFRQPDITKFDYDNDSRN